MFFFCKIIFLLKNDLFICFFNRKFNFLIFLKSPSFFSNFFNYVLKLNIFLFLMLTWNVLFYFIERS